MEENIKTQEIPPFQTGIPVQANGTQPVQSGTSQETKKIITIILLFLVYPIGLLFMWIWTKWKIWVKLLVSGCGCILYIFFISVFSAGLLIALNPKAKIDKANCVKQCENKIDKQTCLTGCLEQLRDQINTQVGRDVLPSIPPIQR